MEPSRMRPTVILPIGAMDKKQITKLNRNGFCVVEAKQPEAVRFLNVPPVADYTVSERAAIELARVLMSPKDCPWAGDTRDKIARMFVDILMKAQPLVKMPVPAVPVVPSSPSKTA
jgi:hypothetical protein